MKTANDRAPKTIPGELRKAALPIEEYAAREGISIQLIEKCARLGVLQIRQFRGQNYVINLPLSRLAYGENYKNTTQTDRLAEINKISQLIQNALPQCEKKDIDANLHKTPSLFINKSPQVRSDLIEEIIYKPDTSDLTELAIEEQTDIGPEKLTSQLEQPENTDNDANLQSDSIQQVLKDIETICNEEETIKIIDDDEPIESQKKPTATFGIDPAIQAEEFGQFIDEILAEQQTQTQPDSGTEDVYQTKFAEKRNNFEKTWRKTAIAAVSISIIILSGFLWMLVDKNSQLEKIELIQAGAGQLNYDLRKSGRDVTRLEKQIDELRSQIEEIMIQQDNSDTAMEKINSNLTAQRAGIDTIRSKLNSFLNNLETVQAHNNKVVERINQDVQKIKKQLDSANNVIYIPKETQ